MWKPFAATNFLTRCTIGRTICISYRRGKIVCLDALRKTIEIKKDRVKLFMTTLHNIVRMGLYYEDIGDYVRALKVFLNACETSPTAETWLGAGIAFYEVN